MTVTLLCNLMKEVLATMTFNIEIRKKFYLLLWEDIQYKVNTLTLASRHPAPTVTSD
jgi:hypothetical protein